MKYWRECLCILGVYTWVLIILSVFLTSSYNNSNRNHTEVDYKITGYGDIGG